MPRRVNLRARAWHLLRSPKYLGELIGVRVPAIENDATLWLIKANEIFVIKAYSCG